MRKFILVALVCILAIVHVHCRPEPVSAEAPPNVALAPAFQTTDSIGFVVMWEAPDPPTANQLPLVGFNVRLIHQTVGDTLVSSMAGPTTYIDSLPQIEAPPVGDSLIVIAAVNSFDTQGNESTWTLSEVFVWVRPIVAPNPPGTVTVDTVLGALVIDSLQVITHASAPQAPDGSFLFNVGDTLRFAAVLFSGPSPVECCCEVITDPPGTHPCDAVQLVSVQSLIPEGRYVPYIRSDRFTMTGDVAPEKLEIIGASLRSRGAFLLPRYQLIQRQMQALVGELSVYPVSID